MSSNLKYANRIKKDVQARMPKKKEPVVNTMSLISLSKSMQKFPQFFDELKINIVQKGICKIDRIPQKYHQIETLYLSNNSIKSLEGVQQFQSLEALSIANNEIEDISFLRYLKQLQNLQTLNLKGNPVCKHPAYKQLVITILPNLQLLDDKAVTREDRHDAEIKLKKHNSLLEMLLSNYCDLIQLNSFNKKLDLHKNMISQNYRFAINDTNLTVTYFRRNFKYEEQLDEEHKDILREHLMRDILTLFYELNEIDYGPGQEQQALKDENYERAFSELIMRQKHKLAELDVKIEKKITAIQQLKAEIRQKFNIDVVHDTRFLDQTARFKTDPGSHEKRRSNSPYQQQQNAGKARTSRPNSPPPQQQKSILKQSSRNNGQPQQQQQRLSRSNNQANRSGQKYQQQQTSPRNGSASPIYIPNEEKDIFTKLSEAQSQLQELQSNQLSYDQIQQNSNQVVSSVQQRQPINVQTNQDQSQFNSNQLIDNLSPIKQNVVMNFPNQNYNPTSSSPFQSKRSEIKSGRNFQRRQFGSQQYTAPSLDQPTRSINNQNTMISDNAPMTNRSLSPKRNIPQPYIGDVKPNTTTNRDCCRRYLGQSKSFLEKTRGSLSPLPGTKRTVTDLERLVQNLQDKLVEKNEQIAQMNDVNQRYKDKIREFYAQNQSNVVIAQNSLEEMDMELSRKQQVQQALESEVKTLRSEINSLIMNNYELEKQKDKVQQLEIQAQNFQEKAEVLQEEKSKNDMAQLHNEMRLQKKFFQYLNYAVKTQTLIKAFRHSWDNMYAKKIAYDLIPKWKTLTLKNKFVRIKNTHLNLKQTSDCFKAWRENIKFQRNITVVLAEKKEKKLKDIMSSWRWFVDYQQSKRNQLVQVDQFREHSLKRKGLIGFKMLFRKMKMNFKENKEKTAKAQKHYVSRLKRLSFKFWKSHHEEVKLPKKYVRIMCQKNYKKYLLRLGLNLFRKNQSLLKYQRIQAIKMNQQRQKKIMQRILVFWKTDLFQINEEKRKLKEISSDIIQRRNYLKWKEVVREQQQTKQNCAGFQKKMNLKIQQKYFEILKKFREKRKLEVYLKNAIITKQRNQIQKTVFMDWFKQAITKKSNRIQESHRNNEIQRYYFRVWTQFSQKQKQRKWKQKGMERKIEKDQKQLQGSVFNTWLTYVRRKKRNREVLKNLQDKKRYQMYRIFVMELHKIMKSSLKYTINKIANKTSLIEANYKQHAEQMDLIDEEKKDLVKQISDQEHEIQVLHEKDLAKDQENLELKKVISQLQTDIETVEIEKEDMNNQNEQIKVNQDEQNVIYQKQVEEFEKQISTLTAENLRLQGLSNQLTEELNFQHNTIHKSEKQMMEKADRAGQLVKETELKLQNSIMMADEFKNRIIEQEQLISELQKRNNDTEDQRKSLTQKLEQCMSVLQEQEIMFNTKVNEQQVSLDLVDGELKEARQTNNYLRSIVSEMKVDLKKYEYQVDILQEDNHRKTKDFIDQLQINQLQSVGSQRNFENVNSFVDIEGRNLQSEFATKQQDIRERLENFENSLNTDDTSNYPFQTTIHKKSNQRSVSRPYTSSAYNTEPINFPVLDEPVMKEKSLLSPRSLLSSRGTPKKRAFVPPTNINNNSLSNIRIMDQQTMYSPATKLRDQNSPSPAHTISKEIQQGKSGRKKARNDLEQRIKKLSENLESDLAVAREAQYIQNNIF